MVDNLFFAGSFLFADAVLLLAFALVDAAFFGACLDDVDDLGGAFLVALVEPPPLALVEVDSFIALGMVEVV